MDRYLAQYTDHLKNEKMKSENTVSAYRRDVREFLRYLEEQGVREPSGITREIIAEYVEDLWKRGRSRSTMNRKLSSVRSFISFLYEQGVIPEMLSDNVRAPKIEKKEVEFLTITEMERLLEYPDDSVKGIRDRAILELMYGTGARVSEVIDLRLDMINLRIGYFTCSGEHGRARIIPLGRLCRSALERYLDESRPVLLEAGRGNEKARDYLFLNFRGENLTRQGLWKIVSSCAEGAGLQKNVTPQILRNSFAVHMLQNGADLKSLQELMGFEDASALQSYLAATKNRIKEVFDRTHPRA